MKGLKQHTLDFEIIQTDNPKTLVFVDASDYYTEPEKPLIEVTLPGYKKFFLVNVVARKVNVFNSNTIGLTQTFNNVQLTDLPDGAYTIRFKVCPYEYYSKEKVFFRTTIIEEKLSNLYCQLDLSTCGTKTDQLLLQDIIEVNVLIEGAKNIASKSVKKANEFYQLANKLIDKALEKLSSKCN